MLGAALVLLLLLAAECGARYVLGLGDPPLFVRDPQVEYLYRPNQRARRFGHRILVNAFGMCSRPFDPRDAGVRPRVLVLGDSVVNGANWIDHAELATTIVERNLVTRGARAALVANVSAPSWGPGNWLAYVRKHGLFGADAIILVVSSHDAFDNPSFGPLDPASHPTAKPPCALAEAAAIAWRRCRRVLVGETGQTATEVPRPQALARGLRDLRELLALARRSGARVAVFQHATRSEALSGHAEPGHDEILALCRTEGVEVQSLAPRFRASMDRGQRPYRDHIHPSAEGQRILAEAMLEWLEDRGLPRHRQFRSDERRTAQPSPAPPSH